MAKKPKESNKISTSNLNSNGDPNSGSDSSNIFTTLFGDQKQSPVSTFSEAINPFQQQKQLGLGFGSAEDGEKTTNGECEDSSRVVKVKKRKRREEKPSLDTGPINDDDDDLSIRLETKKWKMDGLESADFNGGLEETVEGGGSDLCSNLKRVKCSDLGLNKEKGKERALGSESMESLDSDMMEKKKKKKRKRKWEEIEAEYEEMQYGGMVMNDEGSEGGLRGRVVGEKRKHVDDPVDMMMVSKEDIDDEAKLLRTVFVGNLPLKVKKKALVKEFSLFGEIESVRIRSIPVLDTKILRNGAIIQKKTSDTIDSVHAYIVFKTEEAVQASLTKNMALVAGNQIRVDRACPPRKKLKGEDAPLYDNKRTVFIGNLPFDVKDEEIYKLFSTIEDLESSIEAIRIIRDPGTSVGKGIAYVLFKTKDVAKLAVKKRSLKLRDCELRLYQTESNLTPSKRKNTLLREREDSPTKKLAVDLRTPEGSNKVKTKSGSSCQGLQASNSGVSEQTGKKRKLESQTPENYRLNKKTRKLWLV